MTEKIFDIAVIGAGVIGTATAMTLVKNFKTKLVLLEAENKLAAHQTGHNSGVIHSGLYYKPGSLKAKNCVNGRKSLYVFCEQNNIPVEQCGKLVVATRDDELPRLKDLEERGQGNGLADLKRLNKEELKEYEPYVQGIAGLRVQETGIVDFEAVTIAYAQIMQQNGGELRLNHKLIGCSHHNDNIILETTQDPIKCRFIVNCTGLQSDRIAALCGAQPDTRIIPFRGEYYKLNENRKYLVKNLVYPVPDPQFPFLGVHFTRMIDNSVEAGPNAVLAFQREGYTKTDVNLRDVWDYLSFKGFWRMSLRHWRMGTGEFYRSFSKRAFVKALQRLIPAIHMDDVEPAGAGVRAQALDPSGKLLDDFRIIEAPSMIHVLNAPSPAATASISIGTTISEMAAKNFSIIPKKKVRLAPDLRG
ncbi:L-2-hydroxyglutarate oxidase [bacterium]|nr:L-2-hydroxyglutarate oxidase [candidate division CSSED10-310 bacterium]